jgi:Fe-S-cluster-containing dehydrogenase component
MENHYTPGSPWNEMLEYEQGTYPNVSTVFATMGCMHCEEAPCQKICDEIKVHAITKNEYGVVLIDYEKCTGCGYCAPVCPYNVPQFNNQEPQSLYPAGETPYEEIPLTQRHALHRKKKNVMEKCTFCWHKLEKAVEAGEPELIGKKPEYTPSCDLVCPVNARLFGDVEQEDSEVKQYINKKQATQLKKEAGTEPQVYYVVRGGGF